MSSNRTLLHTLSLLLLAICAWLGVILQFATIIPDWLQQGKTMSASFVQFFSYFTILTNSIIAITASAALLFPHLRFGMFCAKPATVTAITMYIVVVGLVYNVVLRPLFPVHGRAKIAANEIVHSVVPLLYLIYWLVFPAKGSIRWKAALSWLIYPLLYLIYTFLNGMFSGYYPYPFLEVKEIGYIRFWLNSFYMLLLFLLLSFALIGLDRWLGRKHKVVVAAKV